MNNLLVTSKPVPFEFLINGQFLRTSIDEFLTLNGISSETVLNVEYTRALIPPIQVASYEQDDWVSSVDILSNSSPAGNWSKRSLAGGQERILSASYDGLLRLWNLSGEVVATSIASNNGGRISVLKATKFLSDKKIVAGGMDGVVRVYKYDEDLAAITPTLELYNHKWAVRSIAVHGPSSRILAASGDNTISVFSASAKASPEAPENLLPTSTTASNKRVKLSRTEDLAAPTATGGALSTLIGHTSSASGVIFAPNDPTVAYSSSEDHTVRIWDLPTGTNVDTRSAFHSLLSLVALPQLNLIATGTSARHITLIDPRENAQNVSVMTLRGHNNAVVSLDTDPLSQYGLVSGSHDGSCRIWDVRSVRPGTDGAVGEGQVGESVYAFWRDAVVEQMRPKISADGPKVFSVRWDKDVGIVSGGDDNKVQINRAPETSASN